MLEGIDVSDVQGIVNWQKVKDSGVSYAFCKATDGESFVAKTFKRNWDGMKSVGIIRGAYHFCHTKNDPTKEATHFVNTVGKLDPTDMLALDIEDDKSILTPEQFLNWTLEFLNTVEDLSNITPIVYTGGPYFDKNGGEPSDNWIKQLSPFPLWLAAYTTNPDKYVPHIWKYVGWTIWQRSGNDTAKGEMPLRVPGINCVVDRNQYKGTIEDFTTFARSLHHMPEKIEPVAPIPIDLDLQHHVNVIDDSSDKPLPKINSFGDNVFQFIQKIFGIK